MIIFKHKKMDVLLCIGAALLSRLAQPTHRPVEVFLRNMALGVADAEVKLRRGCPSSADLRCLVNILLHHLTAPVHEAGIVLRAVVSLLSRFA